MVKQNISFCHELRKQEGPSLNTGQQQYYGPDCHAYVRYAKTIKCEIFDNTVDSTGSGVASDTLEHFYSEFANVKENNDNDNEHNGFSSKTEVAHFSFKNHPKRIFIGE